MDRAIADLDPTLAIEPDERVLEPVPVVALRIVFARMRTAALGSVFGRVQGDHRLLQEVLEFERLSEVAVPNHRAIRNAEIGEAIGDDVDPADTLPEHFGGAKDRAIG